MEIKVKWFDGQGYDTNVRLAIDLEYVDVSEYDVPDDILSEIEEDSESVLVLYDDYSGEYDVSEDEINQSSEGDLYWVCVEDGAYISEVISDSEFTVETSIGRTFENVRGAKLIPFEDKDVDKVEIDKVGKQLTTNGSISAVIEA